MLILFSPKGLLSIEFITLFWSILFTSILISFDSSSSETIINESCLSFFSKSQISTGSSSAFNFKKNNKKIIKINTSTQTQLSVDNLLNGVCLIDFED